MENKLIWLPNVIMMIKNIETEIFIHNTNERTIMLKTYSDVFGDDIMKSLMEEFNGIDKQMVKDIQKLN